IMPAYILTLMKTPVLISASIRILLLKSNKLIASKDKLYLIKKAKQIETEQIKISNRKISQRGRILILEDIETILINSQYKGKKNLLKNDKEVR
ncbi:MAG: hypothetical protein ABIN97_15090, partial [Ginsengibacter sp.]